MSKLDHKTGFSIVEVVVASMVFAIAAVGIFSTIAVIRGPGAMSERKLSAAYYGKRILEELRSRVDSRTWEGGPFGSTGTLPYTNNLAPVVIAGTTYTASYTVTDATPGAPGAPQVRKVVLTITWTEP